ncbi:MAG: hypothetical protein IIT58_03260 [Treponema sp.]|nr:hypothetical protein [Treponema sp.]
MKNKSIFFFAFLFLLNLVFAQTNNTVDLDDSVYQVLSVAELNGYCSKLSKVKPYTQAYIKDKLTEIENNLDLVENKKSVHETQLKIVQQYIKKYEYKNGFDFSKFTYRIDKSESKFPVSFDVSAKIDGYFSSGLYKDKSQNNWGYETYGTLDFCGDFGKNISYRTFAFLDLTKMALTEMGDYYIGNWWKATDDVEIKVDSDPTTLSDQDPRYITKWRNYSVLPYHYKNHWDGSVYYLGNVNAGGLTGWPQTHSFGFGMYGELHGTFFDNHLDIGVGRYNREWAAMDNGSSLALSSFAHPFFALDTTFNLFDCLSLSSLFGTLEFPNQGYINEHAWYRYEDEWQGTNPPVTDSYFFQNLFALAMLNLDFKYVHFDFGSSCILPKRFELGYMFPLIDSVIYQNSIGDYDNLGLFADLSINYPGIGNIWFSLFSDDITSFKAKFWEQSWCAYAYQAGIKSVFPWLPFGIVSFRYTKLEPFCYTHSATKVPWYDYYVATSYTNKGSSLGYYLQPNSDEFLLSFTANPVSALTLGFNWQLIRHGTDWGSGSVEGSNLYSELTPGSARIYKSKYFLLDGTYEWTNMFIVNGSYNFRQINFPLTLDFGIGYIYDWFTGVDTNGVKNDSFHYINDAEYPEINGFVFSLGFTLFGL